MSDQKRLLALLGIMAGVAMAVAVLSIWLLYRTAFTEQRHQLSNLAQTQVQAILTLAEHVSAHIAAKGLPTDRILTSTMSRFSASLDNTKGFAKSGEYIIGRREAGNIVFLLRNAGGAPQDLPNLVSFDSDSAEPMRRALSGKSGTMTGHDFANRNVLAAYEPIPALGLGIVAKIDLAELRAPFLRAAGISGIGAVLILLLGTVLFRRISSPLVENLEQTVARLTEAQRIARLGNWERNIATGEGWWSDESFRIFGLESSPAAPTLEDILVCIHEDDRDAVETAIDKCMAGKEPYSLDFRIILPDGTVKTLHGRGTWNLDKTGRANRISGTVQDVTLYRQAEENTRRLVDAIEGLSENFSLYGPDDRLILCNEGYRRINKELPEESKPGVLFEDHVRARADKTIVPGAIGRKEEWVQERLANHRNPTGPFEFIRHDGVWLQVNEQRMPDGSTVSISIDITKRKRTEQRLHDAIETISDGFAFYDADERLVLANSRYLANVKLRPAIFTGALFEDVIRQGIKVGLTLEAIGREEEWLAERLAHFRNPTAGGFRYPNAKPTTAARLSFSPTSPNVNRRKKNSPKNPGPWKQPWKAWTRALP